MFNDGGNRIRGSLQERAAKLKAEAEAKRRRAAAAVPQPGMTAVAPVVNARDVGRVGAGTDDRVGMSNTADGVPESDREEPRSDNNPDRPVSADTTSP